ncbi:MAG: RagB/SusD family nutrient uptake outer membrane protein [Bacteroidales bacterium]|jgi:hypothetical protein
MKNKILGSLLLLMIILFGGCTKDLLNLDPKTSLGETNAFETKDRIVGQVNGMYAFMKSGAFLGGRYFVYNDVRAENFLPKSTNLVTNYATWNHTVLSSTNEVQNLWGAVYAGINAINIFIDGLNSHWGNGNLDGIITEAEYNQYKSEALALRAISYFDLLQLYAQPFAKNNGDNPGLPLRLKGMKTGDENDMARSTVAEVYQQILLDLDTAEPLAIEVYSTDLLNTTRIHRNTIIAFKTRVFLHMNNWAKVIAESAKIVTATAPFVAPTGRGFALNATFAGVFAIPYTSKESIFSMPFTSTNLAGTQNGLAHYYHPSSSESYFLDTIPGTTFTKIDMNDARKKLMVKNGGNYFVGKWTNFTVQTDYAPVMRYAEVLLNYAEAIARNANSANQQALDLLNAVRSRSFATGAYALSDFGNLQAFLDAVMLERNIEFLAEGIRNMDIMRTVTDIPAKGGVSTIPPTSQSYIWPIPTSELNINKLMIGN